MEHTQPLPRMIGALLRIPFQATVEQVYQRLLEAGYTDLRPYALCSATAVAPAGLAYY